MPRRDVGRTRTLREVMGRNAPYVSKHILYLYVSPDLIPFPTNVKKRIINKYPRNSSSRSLKGRNLPPSYNDLL